MDASSTRTRFTPFVVTENSSIEELRGVLPNKDVPIYARKKNGVVTIYFDEMKKNASAEKAHLAIARLLNPGGEANKTMVGSTGHCNSSDLMADQREISCRELEGRACQPNRRKSYGIAGRMANR